MTWDVSDLSLATAKRELSELRSNSWDMQLHELQDLAATLEQHIAKLEGVSR